MYLSIYEDRFDDFVALGRTKKEAERSLMDTLKINAFDSETLLDDFESEKQFIDNSISTYKICAGETVKLGYDIHYKKGHRC